MQPTFFANYLAIDIKPSPGGGLAEGTKVEIRFKDQAMFGFVSTLEKLRERALFMKRESAMGEDLRKLQKYLPIIFQLFIQPVAFLSYVHFTLNVC